LSKWESQIVEIKWKKARSSKFNFFEGLCTHGDILGIKVTIAIFDLFPRWSLAKAAKPF
jgi:hypothetical protein